MDTKTINIILQAQDRASKVIEQAAGGFKKMETTAQNVSDKIGEAGRKMQDFGKKMTTSVTLPIVAMGGLSVKAFSDLQETMNKVEVSFGEQSDAVKEWAKTSIDSMGLAQQSALDAAALFGDMGTGMGQTQGEAQKMSTQLTQLAADMSSFKNVSFERSQTALSGIYTGETEALKSLGIVMTQANLEQFAMNKGIEKSIQDMTQAEKVQLRYEFVMAKTANAQGDFARTSDSIANKSRKQKEKMKELSAEVGKKLSGAYTQLLEVGDKVLSWFSGLSEGQQQAILIAAGVLAAIGPLVSIFGAVATAIKGVTIALTFLGAHPIILIIMAVVAVIAGAAFLIIKNWDTLKKWFGAFWNFLKKTVSNMVGFIKRNWDKLLVIFLGPLGLILAVVIKNFSRIRSFIGAVFGGIRSAASSAWNFVSNIWNKAFGFFSRIGNGIKSGISAGIEGAKGIAKGGMNAIIGIINGIIRGVNNTAGRIPGVPNIPEIPRLQKGTNFFKGGLAVVGERGPEVVAMPRGSRVITNSQSGDFLDEQGAGGGRSINVVNNIYNQVDMDMVVKDLEWRMAQ